MSQGQGRNKLRPGTNGSNSRMLPRLRALEARAEEQHIYIIPMGTGRGLYYSIHPPAPLPEMELLSGCMPLAPGGWKEAATAL